MLSIGVDIGATTTKAGLVEDGQMLSRIKQTTPKTKQKLLKTIVELVQHLLSAHNIKANKLDMIGIGVPGAVQQDGVIRFATNLGIKNYDLISDLKQYFDVTILATNDASAAAIAEYKFGKYKGTQELATITLGTGVGLGFVHGGKIYDTPLGGDGELGHIVIDINGEQCTCGRSGCLETFVSKQTLISGVQKNKSLYPDSKLVELENVDVKDIFDAYHQKDSLAIMLVDNYIKYLAIGVTNLINLVRPSVIILGGAIADQGTVITEPIKKYIRQYAYGGAKDIVISTPTVKHSGIIGAANLS